MWSTSISSLLLRLEVQIFDQYIWVRCVFVLLFLCGCVAQLDFRFAHCLLTRPVNIYHLLQGSAEHTGHPAPAATPRVCKHQFAATFDLSVDLLMFAPVSAQKGEIEW